MNAPLSSKTESLKARVFDGKGWNKAFVEGALIHDLWAEAERLRSERDTYKAQAAAHWQAVEELQRMIASSAHETAVAHGRIPAANPQLQAHISAVGDFMEELGPYLGLEDGLVKTGEFIEAAKRIRQWCHDHQRPLDFVRALKIAEGVFEQYGKDQPKWWRRMDGTPILNDVAVRMAEAFRADAQSPVKTEAERPLCSTCKTPMRRAVTDYGVGWQLDCKCKDGVPK